MLSKQLFVLLKLNVITRKTNEDYFVELNKKLSAYLSGKHLKKAFVNT